MSFGSGLSVSIAGWEGDWASPRGRIEAAAGAGARSVQLDATLAGIRPRELDRSARRDLASLFKRLELAFSGLDLFIPAEHFADPRHADRALTAAAAACELASELSALTSGNGRVVCLTLPASADAATLATLGAAADRAGVVIADLTWPVSDALRAAAGPHAPLAPGIDPASLLMSGADPVLEAARFPGAVAAARLSDASTLGRVVPGAPGGRLDVPAFRAALHARGFAGALVLDLRGLRQPDKAARASVDRWGAPA